jgi:hypothetical protein
MPAFLPTIIAQFDFLGSAIGVVVSIVVSFALITLVASYYRFQHILELAEKEKPEEAGVVTADFVRVQLARYLTTCARRGTSFSVALVRPVNPDVSARTGAVLTDAIADKVRKTMSPASSTSGPPF